MKPLKRALSLLLALLLVFTVLPWSSLPRAYAAELPVETAAEPAQAESAPAPAEEPQQDRAYAFTTQPKNGSIAIDGSLKITWAVNFTPTKIEITAQRYGAWAPSVVATLSGTATSYVLTYNKARNYGTNATYFVKAYYGGGYTDYVPSRSFSITYEPQEFTIQPQNGSIKPDSSCIISWNTNFIPRKIVIVGRKYGDLYFKEIATLHGFTTLYFLTYEKAIHYGRISGYYQVRAYYDDDEDSYLASNTFQVFLTGPEFLSAPTGAAIDPDDYCVLEWETNFTPKKVVIQGHDWHDPMTGFSDIAVLPGTTTSYSLTYYSACRFGLTGDYRIRAYYGDDEDEYVTCDEFKVGLDRCRFTKQPNTIELNANGDVSLNWLTNFYPSKIVIQGKNWKDYMAEYHTIATLYGGPVNYTLPYNTLIQYGLTGKYRVIAYYANDTKSVTSDEIMIPISRPAFVRIPVGSRIDPGDPCVIEWETNFAPSRVEIWGRKFTDFVTAATLVKTISNPGTVGYVEIPYSTAEQFGSNGRYWVVAYFGNDARKLTSDEFFIRATPRTFTTQPVGGTVYVGKTTELSWDTNFNPSHIEICGRSYSAPFNSSTVIKQLPGAATAYDLTLEDALQFGTVSWICVKAYDGDKVATSQETLVRAFPTVFTSQPPSSIVLEEGGTAEISWATSVTLSSLKLMLIPEGSDEAVEVVPLVPGETSCEVSFEGLEAFYELLGVEADTGKLFLRANSSLGEYDSKQIYFRLNYQSSGTVGNLNWNFDRLAGKLTITGSGIMPDLTDIPWAKFTNKITEVEVGNGVTVIGQNAFNGSRALRTVRLPGTLREIRMNAFLGCTYVTGVHFDGSAVAWNAVTKSIGNTSLTAVTAKTTCYDTGTCGSGLTWTLGNDNVLTVSGSGAMANYDNASNLAPWAAYRDRIVKVVIQNGVTTIGSQAFSHCSVLTDVDASAANLQSVGASAFYQSTALKTVTGFDKNTLTSLGNCVFQECASLEWIHLGSFITAIPDYAFSGCSSLTVASIPSSAASIGAYAYNGCSSLRAIQMAKNGLTTDIKERAFYNCTALVNANLPDQITSIGNYAFGNCTGLETVHLPASLTELNFGAFSNCRALKSKLTIPAGIVKISGYTFQNCENLTEVTLNEGLTAIYDYAFYGTGLSGFLTVPAGVTVIGKGSFMNTKIYSLTLPNSLTGIKTNAFQGCSNLGVVWYQGLQSQWGGIDIESGNSALTGAQIIFLGTSGDINGIKWYIQGDGVLTVYNPASAPIPDMSAGGQPWAEFAADIKQVEVLNNTGGIGANVFRDLPNLKTVYLAASVLSIGENAFANCPSLTDVYTDDSSYYWSTYVTVASGNTALTNALHFSRAEDVLDENPDLMWRIEGDTLVIDASGSGGDDWAIPDFGNGEMTPWYDYAGAIKRVRFGDCVTRIGSETLRGLQAVTVVEIPLACTEIAEGAFDCPHLETVYYGGMQGDWSAITVGDYNNELTNAEIVYGCSSDDVFGADLRWMIDAGGTLTISIRQEHNERYAIPDYTETDTRPWEAYKSQIQKIRIESGVTGIGECAFYGLSNLEEVYLPDTLTAIKYKAFGLSGLTKIAIPDSVTTLGECVFWNCDELAEVILPTGIRSIPYGTFFYCTELVSILVPEGVTTIEQDAFKGCRYLERIDLPSTLTAIEYAAFQYCTGILDVYVNKDWTDSDSISIDSSYNSYLFDRVTWHYNCPGGKLENGLTWELKENGCLEIAGVGPMPDFQDPSSSSSTNIPPWYAKRTFIDSVEIGDGVTKIGDYSFRNCTNLTSAAIADTVTGIGQKAFLSCVYLTSVEIPEGVAVIGNNGFATCTRLTDVTLPSTLTKLEFGAFYNCTALEQIELPEGLTTMGSQVFSNCTHLSSVSLPTQLTTITDRTFLNCSALQSVQIEENVKTIQFSAFDGCTALTDVYYGGIQEWWNNIIITTEHSGSACNGPLLEADLTCLGVPENESYFPDEGFRDLLFGGGTKDGSDYDLNGDGYLSEAECDLVTTIDCRGKEIESLEGIDRFPNLMTLKCSDNLLTELDLSGNLSLLYLYCQNNRIEHLNLSGLEQIEIVDCRTNRIDEIVWDDIACASICEVYCSDNELTELDLGHSFDCLYYLDCSGNEIEELTLDPDDFPYLEKLMCAGNRLTELDVDGMDTLWYLDCSDNGMSELDVNANLENLCCAGNGLTELDLSDVPALVKTYKEGSLESLGGGRERYARSGDWVLEIDSDLGLHGADDTFIEVYFVYKWNDLYDGEEDCPIYAYAFGSNNLENGAFPGVELESFNVVCDADTDNPIWCKAYLIRLDSYFYHDVVFSDGSGSQTADLAFADDAGDNDYVIYYADGFGTVNVGTDLWPTEDYVHLDPSCETAGSNTYFGLKTAAGRTQTLDAYGHVFSAGTVHEPTCAEEGWTDYVCSRCGSLEKRDFDTELADHDFGDWTVTDEPTCTDEGGKTRTCSVCGLEEFASVEATGHEWGEAEYAFSDPGEGMTCTAAAECAVCGETLTETATGDYAVVVAPTTEQTGFAAYSFHFEDPAFADQIWTVELETLEGETVTVYVVDRSDALDMANFVWGDYGDSGWPGVPMSPKGVDKDGNYYYCFDVDVTGYGDGLILNDTEGRQYPLPDQGGLDLIADADGRGWVVYAIGVDYTVQTEADVWPAPGTVTCEPTCEDEGEEEFTGLLTGAPVYGTVPALGHAWDEGVVTLEPTTEAPGVKTYTCTRCGETRTEQIPKLLPFEDVAPDAWYADAVAWALENGVTAGTSENSFSPDNNCTRVQIVTFLWAASDKPEPTSAESPFIDVQNPNAYYYKAVLWAYENEITVGVGPAAFGVNHGCSRAQAVTFLWRLAGSPEPTRTDTGFIDVPANAWYADAVRWAVENEITAGTSPTTFSPYQTCTRAQIVTFLYKYMVG